MANKDKKKGKEKLVKKPNKKKGNATTQGDDSDKPPVGPKP